MNLLSLKNTGVSSNFWKMAIIYITNKRFAITILSIYFLTLQNVTLQTIGVISLFANLTSFVFEVPSGYFAGRIGHRKTLIIGKLLIALSSSIYIFAHSIPFFIFAGVCFALGGVMMSGTSSAFIKDSLVEIKKPDEFISVFSKIKALGLAIPVLFIILVPYLAVQNYKYAFIFIFLIDVIGLVAAMSLHEVYHPLKEVRVKKPTLIQILKNI